MSQPDADKPIRVVIVGGAVTGFNVAVQIANSFRPSFPLSLFSKPHNVQVTLVERQSQRLVNFATVRAVVDEEFAKTVFVPYDKLFDSETPSNDKSKFGSIIHGKATKVETNQIVLESGRTVPFDYLVIATGAKYVEPFVNSGISTEHDLQQLQKWAKEVSNAKSIVIVGAGAVGIELAAEIKAKYGDAKSVALIASGPKLSLGMTSDALAVRIDAKLKNLGVVIHYNQQAVLPPPPLAHIVGPHTIKTKSDTEFPSDLTFLAIGTGGPNSEFVESLYDGSVLNEKKEVKVKSTLQVDHPNLSHVFSLGDVAATRSPKTAIASNFQVKTVVTNIVHLIKNGNTARLVDYAPEVLKSNIGVSIGPKDGAAELFGMPAFLTDTIIKSIKSPHLLVDKLRKDHGL